jgi:uncharacterized RDD family membrane protein YckC
MKPVGDGTRILNFLVDTLLVFGLAYSGYKVWTWYVLYWHYTFYSFGWFFAAALVLYYFFFETFFGRTPGKWVSVSRVVTATGNRPGFIAVLIRSLARLTVIDLFFIPFLGKPLHDYLSKTTVVEA